MVTYRKHIMYIALTSIAFTSAYAEIKVKKNETKCAMDIYELVRSAISRKTEREKSLYQDVKNIFSSSEMKKVVRKSDSSVPELYETAANIAYQQEERDSNDIKAMIVLHIAAEDARRPWHERPNSVFAVSFAEGFVLGIGISYVAVVFFMRYLQWQSYENWVNSSA